MAKSKTRKKPAKRPLSQRLRRWLGRSFMAIVALPVVAILLFSFLRPPTTPYIMSEYFRLGQIDRDWVPVEDISPHMLVAVVAAEDVNFCRHWGLDLTAIRAALAEGGARGGSTISQQTVKNLVLWQGRSWARKAIEAVLTPFMEAAWTKQRILEVYLNIAEFDTGVFGVEAASRKYFGVPARQLTAAQAARLAMVLPNPKGRDAGNPDSFERRRAAHIADGAAIIAKDTRTACFLD